jgi:hypothetical protein
VKLCSASLERVLRLVRSRSAKNRRPEINPTIDWCPHDCVGAQDAANDSSRLPALASHAPVRLPARPPARPPAAQIEGHTTTNAAHLRGVQLKFSANAAPSQQRQQRHLAKAGAPARAGRVQRDDRVAMGRLSAGAGASSASVSRVAAASIRRVGGKVASRPARRRPIRLSPRWWLYSAPALSPIATNECANERPPIDRERPREQNNKRTNKQSGCRDAAGRPEE